MNRTRSVLVLQILLLVSMNQIIIQAMKTQAKQRGMQSLFLVVGGTAGNKLRTINTFMYVP